MTGPRDTPPLDLRAVPTDAAITAAINAFAFANDKQLTERGKFRHALVAAYAVDEEALLAHCRALRAALSEAQEWMGYRAESHERMDVLLEVRKRAAAVLAQATDK